MKYLRFWADPIICLAIATAAAMGWAALGAAHAVIAIPFAVVTIGCGASGVIFMMSRLLNWGIDYHSIDEALEKVGRIPCRRCERLREQLHETRKALAELKL